MGVRKFGFVDGHQPGGGGGEVGATACIDKPDCMGKVSLKSLEITSDNQAVSHQLLAFNEQKILVC